MSTTIDILRIRRYLGRKIWQPPRPHGPDGWTLLNYDGRSSIIVTAADWGDGTVWVHASRTGPDRIPTYDELQELHRAVWGEGGYSYQVQAPAAQHVNIHPYALHLWGRSDGAPVLPEFGALGSI